mmetsp:Transcript_1247/g.3841  ORF Transcript_1247/g.3841 Transcript_1247/m.3841 type:complete len:240 (+) Transcript_1247:489-1208(+)
MLGLAQEREPIGCRVEQETTNHLAFQKQAPAAHKPRLGDPSSVDDGDSDAELVEDTEGSLHEHNRRRRLVVSSVPLLVDMLRVLEQAKDTAHGNVQKRSVAALHADSVSDAALHGRGTLVGLLVHDLLALGDLGRAEFVHDDGARAGGGVLGALVPAGSVHVDTIIVVAVVALVGKLLATQPRENSTIEKVQARRRSGEGAHFGERKQRARCGPRNHHRRLRAGPIGTAWGRGNRGGQV